MRLLALTLLLATVPGAAAAQSSPRSLALELGFASDSAEVLGTRTPVALSAAWWLTGNLDAVARVAWGFAARSGGRRADGSFEVGGGVRCSLATWGALRPELVADIAFVQAFGTPGTELWASDSGVRLGAGAALEFFFARDLALGMAARATELALVSGAGGPGLAFSGGIAVYF
jgi:hypothetical protein